MSRRDIYYWKCDRPAAFHGTQERHGADAALEVSLREALCRHFNTECISLETVSSQGNHLTWKAQVDKRPMFIRVENGPERDDHLAVESTVITKVRSAGVPVPMVYGVDASRSSVDFAWQALECIPAPDLNHWFKKGTLDTAGISFQIGAAVARWQQVELEGFGPLNSDLRGYNARYEDYFQLRLKEHLGFLVERGFMSEPHRDDIAASIDMYLPRLQVDRACLVHKDLALWNILGSHDHIDAFIDFDDAIAGDAMDDLSLLACFHDATFLAGAFDGYRSLRPMPEDHLRRFWLHLLRNMIVKAVIRVGAGYFERNDGFFLIGSGASGADLRAFTQQRLATALHGLNTNADITLL